MNLGGAGEFARRLRLLRDEGRATHGPFMDDDIRLEADWVRRARVTLSTCQRCDATGESVRPPEYDHMLAQHVSVSSTCNE
jgi:hypothetical protein